MLKLDAVRETLDAEAVGYVLIGVLQDGSAFAEAKELGLVSSLVAAHKGIPPRDIIAATNFLGRLTEAEPEKPRRGPKGPRVKKSALKDPDKPEAPAS